jgi:hypothetical protein
MNQDQNRKSVTPNRAIPIAGFNSARIVKGEVRTEYFPKRRENTDRIEVREIRRGIRDLPDRHIGMLLTLTNNSANREVQREAERELRQRHHGKVIIEL